MYQVATLNKISKAGLSHFNEKYIITEDVEAADGILVRSQDMLTMDFADGLKAIARAGAGVNNIPLDRCAEKGILVFNTPGANANAVKELVICGMLMATRNIPRALTWAKGLTEDVSKQVEKGKSQFAGHEILGKTIGIIGLGAIGRKILGSCKALGMNVLGYDPFYVSGGEGISVYSDLKEMLPLCDFITLHLPANANTKGMINKELFGLMKEGAVLLNFSRDQLVNDMDLAAALETGKISQYVTDFPNDNLVGREGVILIPHLGASTEEAEDNCAIMAVEEMMEFFEHGNIVNSVNFPALDMGPLESGSRLAFVVKGMADPMSEIMEMLSAANVNISKAKCSRRQDDISYVLVETPQEHEEGFLFTGETGAKIISFRKIKK